MESMIIVKSLGNQTMANYLRSGILCSTGGGREGFREIGRLRYLFDEFSVASKLNSVNGAISDFI